MSGTAYIAVGGIILFLSSVSLVLAEWWIGRKKKQIREQTYHIYE